MEKAIILSISKKPLRNEFQFKKEQKIVEILMKVLKELGFVEPLDHNLKDLLSEQGTRKINLKKFIDEVYSMSNNNYNIDILIGTRKVILIIRTKSDKQQEISEIIFKFADFKN